ncbi:hypothetical protein MKOR_12950 [Mycolicibacillus koreensis]|nr:hypothetical protein MKOR_12950 [Mycolicibacillus koreensis]
MGHTGDHSAFDRDQKPSEGEAEPLHPAIRNDREQIAGLSRLSDLPTADRLSILAGADDTGGRRTGISIAPIHTPWVGHFLGSLGI